MDYSKLHYFRIAAETENFTRAAELTGVSQAYLSQVIKKLEAEVGAELFSRHGRNVRLNECGKILLKAVQTANEAVKNATNEITSALSTDTQRVRFIARSPIGDFPRIMSDFYKTHPDILMSNVPPGQDNVALDWDLEYFASDDDLHEQNVMKLCQEELVLMASRKHDVAKRSSIFLHELEGLGFVASPLETEMTQKIDSLFGRAGFEPRIKCFSSSYWESVNLVEQNVGVCLGFSKSWMTAMQLDVVQIPLADVNAHRYLYVRWPKGAYITNATIALIDYLQDVFADSNLERNPMPHES